MARIAVASRAVCGERAGYTMDAVRAKIFTACVGHTTSDAVQTVDAPQLTQLAATR